MILVFDNQYQAISNIMVHTVEDKDYTYPAPLAVSASLADEKNQTTNLIEFTYSNYLESLLTLDRYFSVFAYLLTYTYHINVLFIDNLIKVETTPTSTGYTGKYTFNSDFDLTFELGNTEIYDDFIKIQKASL